MDKVAGVTASIMASTSRLRPQWRRACALTTGPTLIHINHWTNTCRTCAIHDVAPLTSFSAKVFSTNNANKTFFDRRIFRWYRSLCIGPSDKEEWKEGPVNISPQCQIAPMLLRMTWDGFPLYHTRKHGWGYLVPGRTDNLTSNLVTLPSNEDEHLETEKPELTFPTRYVDT